MKVFCTLFIALLIQPVIAQDSLALVALYESTNGTAWNNNDNWLSGSVDSWYGITVAGGRVVTIALSDNNLNGTIPPEIGSLDQLADIYLYNNPNLTGSLPSEIGQLTNVWNISIDNTGISGSIPPEIGQMSNLYYVSLTNNQLNQ